MSRLGATSFVVLAAVLLVGTPLVVLGHPLLLPVVVLGITAFVILLRWPNHASALLLAAALPFARPNILGERLSPVALGLAVLAALLALAGDRSTQVPKIHLVTPVWVVVSYLWSLFLLGSTDQDVRPVYQGLMLTGGFLACAAVVLTDRARRVLVARSFVAMIVVLCGSYAVTALLWTFAGVGSAHLLDVRPIESPQPVYFPFTVTAGTLTDFGVTFPRLTGIGREPGWMSMYAAFSFILLPRIGWHSHWMKALLLVGVLGCVSTAGFGVFIVVYAFERCLRARPGSDHLTSLVRQAVGLVAVGGALWLAVAAPGLGLQAKTTLNKISYEDRYTATVNGLHALLSGQILGRPGSATSINLVASIVTGGIPYALFILAALLWPRIGHPRKHLTTAPVAVLVLTLVASQPAGDSTWVYLLAMVAYGVAWPAAGDIDPVGAQPLALVAPLRRG